MIRSIWATRIPKMAATPAPTGMRRPRLFLIGLVGLVLSLLFFACAPGGEAPSPAPGTTTEGGADDATSTGNPPPNDANASNGDDAGQIVSPTSDAETAQDGAVPDGGLVDAGASLDAALNPDVLAVVSKVATYGITQYGDAGCDWANAAFFPGLLAAYQATGDAAFRDAATAWGQNQKWLVCTASAGGAHVRGQSMLHAPGLLHRNSTSSTPPRRMRS